MNDDLAPAEGVVTGLCAGLALIAFMLAVAVRVDSTGASDILFAICCGCSLLATITGFRHAND